MFDHESPFNIPSKKPLCFSFDREILIKKTLGFWRSKGSKARTPAAPPRPGAAWPPRSPCGRRPGPPPWALRGHFWARLCRWRCTGRRNLGETMGFQVMGLGKVKPSQWVFRKIWGKVDTKSEKDARDFKKWYSDRVGWMLENRRITSWQLGFAPHDAWHTHGIPSQAGSP